MSINEERIRGLIEAWAKAVHRGEPAAVVADHAEDIVMFDVPGEVRGIETYRKAWPPFFEWQAQGALFEIETLEVTAGDDVAFAHALLRCGMPEDVARHRLRLTLGLRKKDGRWVVAHEHHSFPLADHSAGDQEG
ncbi:YybH family protein [Nonomuraea sp. NPDC050022]|uniref:YybH family protein n=1 Tax=Nonomuraea sp. NPDC050022 TaxID=3364358 RepID=UPI0037875E22